MSIVLDLPRPVEARIEREAQQAGVSPAKLVADVLEKKYTAPFDVEEQKRLNAPSIALLQSWLERGREPHTPEELAEAEEEQIEFMRNMNAPRRESGERLPYPDVEAS